MSQQLDGTLVTLLVQIGGYKELIINYARMFSLTEDETYLKNVSNVSRAMVRTEEELHKYLKKTSQVCWLPRFQREKN